MPECPFCGQPVEPDEDTTTVAGWVEVDGRVVDAPTEAHWRCAKAEEDWARRD